MRGGGGGSPKGHSTLDPSLRSCEQCRAVGATIWKVMADLGDPWKAPKPPALVLKWQRHIWSGTESINREMFTRWLEVLGLMWFQVFQWSPQRALPQIPPPAKLWGMDALGVQAGSMVRAGGRGKGSAHYRPHQTSITLVSGRPKETQGIQTHNTALHKNSQSHKSG